MAAPGKCVLTLPDSTERQLAERKRWQRSRLHAALSACNQAVVRCASQEQLLARICLTSVTVGGMKMAWIGMVEPAIDQLLPVASFGFGAPNVTDLEPLLSTPTVPGWSSAMTAARLDRSQWDEDVLQTSACIPLHRKGVVVGVLVLLSDGCNPFDEDAQRMVTEMASVIDSALKMLDLKTLPE